MSGVHAMLAFRGSERSFSSTERGRLLAHSLYLKGLRAWTREGCYAWWRLTDEITQTRKLLASLRLSGKARSNPGEVAK